MVEASFASSLDGGVHAIQISERTFETINSLEAERYREAAANGQPIEFQVGIRDVLYRRLYLILSVEAVQTDAHRTNWRVTYIDVTNPRDWVAIKV